MSLAVFLAERSLVLITLLTQDRLERISQALKTNMQLHTHRK